MSGNELVYAMTSAVMGFVISFLALRKGSKADTVAAQAGVTDSSQAGIQQVIDGLNKTIEALDKIVENLQDDNEVLRTALRNTSMELAALREQCKALHGKNGNGSEYPERI